MHLLRSVAWRPVAIAALAGGVALAGIYYGASYLAYGPPTERAAPAAAVPVPPESAVAPAPAAPGLQPGLGGLVLGSVTAVATNPPSFTILTPTGEQMTYQVLPSTVFTAGRDRPYNFGLLKVGDEVRLRGGQRQAAGIASAGQSGAAQGVQGQRLGLRDQVGGGPVARFVVVRPAGEPRQGRLGQAQPRGTGPIDGANR